MHFIILGAGAIGCYVGGRLAQAGNGVSLVGRSRVVVALAASGLTVTDLDGFNAHVLPDRLGLATSLAAALAACKGDAAASRVVILLCVKGGATESAAQETAQACPAGTPVISLQNGVDNVARIQAQAPRMRALAGMVPYNVVMLNDHQVHRATTGSLHIQQDPLTAPLLPLFNAAGLATELTDDMRAVQWGKLLLNLNNPVNALSDLPLQAQLRDRDYRRVLASLQTEALGVMAVAGITPTKAAAVAPRALPHLLRLPNWLFTRVAARMLRMDASARSSMWVDLQQGRTTEIDDLCGAVVRLARGHAGSAPLNARMCELIAQHPPGARLSGPQLRDALMA